MNQALDIDKLSMEALGYLKKYGIPPTPDHYAVWYQYAMKIPKISSDIDSLIKQGKSPDESFSQKLFHEHIEDHSHKEMDALGDMKEMLNHMLNTIHEFSGGQDQYQQQMDAHISDLNHQSETKDIADIVQEILKTTHVLKEHSAKTVEKLEATKAETEKLRNNLAQVTKEAQRDFLTGLFNRKAMDKILLDLISLSDKHKTPLSLLIIDIDHFKQFNDKYGHLIGDVVLKKVALVLKDSLKGRDIIARFGGEEFVAILPNTNSEGALVVAENIRHNIACKELHRRDNNEVIGQITVSVGVAQYDQQKETMDQFIARADEALYKAKEAGRNQVKFV